MAGNPTTVPLGSDGVRTARIGLGCMGMSGAYGPSDRAEGIETIHHALDAGITLIDTGDFYGSGHNELLVGEALRSRRDEATISVKFGAMRAPAGALMGFDARPGAVKNFATYSLVRLGTDHIDIYRPARLDPAVPIEETIGAIAELVESGHVRHIGLSEVGPETIRRAHAVHPITDLQIEYALISRGIEAEILPVCRELGIGITAYGVLSRGLLSGNWSPDRSLSAGDFRAHSPRFGGDHLDHNLGLVDTLRKIAEEAGTPVSQVAIAWVLSRGDDIVPIIGSRRPDQLADAAAALDVELSSDQLAQLEAAFPVGVASGDRYPTAAMSHLPVS